MEEQALEKKKIYVAFKKLIYIDCSNILEVDLDYAVRLLRPGAVQDELGEILTSS